MLRVAFSLFCLFEGMRALHREVDATPHHHRDIIELELNTIHSNEVFTLPPLPYAYDALEPYIDKETMEFHHDKHHATYISNLNDAYSGKDAPSLLDIVKGAITNNDATIRNNGGGTYNHHFFWLVMAPNGTGGARSPKLEKAINETFGSFVSFQAKFNDTAFGRFGSGWAWLVVADGKLEVTSTANQDNPLMDGVDGIAGIPILGLDVWEHAYYLKHQNLRKDYIDDWWEVVNWNQVNAWYEDALKEKEPNFANNGTLAS